MIVNSFVSVIVDLSHEIRSSICLCLPDSSLLLELFLRLLVDSSLELSLFYFSLFCFVVDKVHQFFCLFFKSLLFKGLSLSYFSLFL